MRDDSIPGLQTTVAHSHFLQGNYDAAIAHDTDLPPYLTMLSLFLSERRDEALSIARAIEPSTLRNRLLSYFVIAMRAMLEDRLEEGRKAVLDMEGPGFSDPEGWFYWAHLLVGLDDAEGAIGMLARMRDRGWSCASAIERSPGLVKLHRHPSVRADPGSDSRRRNDRRAGVRRRGRTAAARLGLESGIAADAASFLLRATPLRAGGHGITETSTSSRSVRRRLSSSSNRKSNWRKKMGNSGKRPGPSGSSPSG